MNTNRIERRSFLMGAAGVAAGLVAADLVGGHALAADKPADAAKKADWIPLFNGKDLAGWKPEGNAKWTVENGCLVGVQGPNCAPGDLFTEKEFANFELRVTYKIVWPANSGIWFRYQGPEKSYQADILEYKDPVAYSGTIYCPGKLFLAANKDASIVKKDDWNTMYIRAEGDHLVVKLNDTLTGDVHEGSMPTGKIGFQIHPGDEFKNMKITVKEIVLRNL